MEPSAELHAAQQDLYARRAQHRAKPADPPTDAAERMKAQAEAKRQRAAARAEKTRHQAAARAYVAGFERENKRWPQTFSDLKLLYRESEEAYRFVLTMLGRCATDIEQQREAYRQNVERHLHNAISAVEQLTLPDSGQQSRIEDAAPESDQIELHRQLTTTIIRDHEELLKPFREYLLMALYDSSRGNSRRINKADYHQWRQQHGKLGKRGLRKAIAPDVDNIFFRQTTDREHYYLCSLASVMFHFGVNADRHSALAPARLVAQHPKQLRMLALRLEQQRRPDKPITRASLAAQTGISERRQREYDNASNTRQTAYYAKATNTAANRLKFGYAVYKTTDDGHTLIVRRGNIYHPAALTHSENRKKRAKRLNHAANSVAKKSDAAYPSAKRDSVAKREYFGKDQAREGVKAAERGQPVYMPDGEDMERPRHRWGVYLTSADNKGCYA